ncbi:hypothetical protein KSS87_008432 [Heliosperma pusillum]|nr:hypothetical protein KSS87_008432 [Heliosperma pusillum]
MSTNPTTNNHRVTAESTQPTTTSHRRVQSETLSYNEDDDFAFDAENFNFFALDIMSPESGDSASSSHTPSPPIPPHLRSLSVNTTFFDGLSFAREDVGVGEGSVHQRTGSGSMDSGGESGDVVVDGVTRAVATDKLAELAPVDPRRARRNKLNSKCPHLGMSKAHGPTKQPMLQQRKEKEEKRRKKGGKRRKSTAVRCAIRPCGTNAGLGQPCGSHRA